MNSSFERAPIFSGWSRVLPYVLAAALAPALRLGFVFFGGDDWQAASALWTARAERLLALVFLGLALRAFFLRRSVATETEATDDPAANPAFGTGALFLIFVPMLFFFACYSWLGYAGFYLGDQDFTNISSALNNTARGQGLLSTAYVDTGRFDTFLAHHFAPALLLFVPFYWLAGFVAGLAPAFAPTHFLYAVLLFAALVAGLAGWTRIVARRIPAAFAPGLLLAFATAPVLWRIAGSFHFEILVLPAAALVFGARGRAPFWIGVVFFLAIKEDMALYLAGFAVWSVWRARDGRERRRGLALIVVCVFYFAAALLAMRWLDGSEAGAGGVAWAAYWRDVWGTSRDPASALVPLLWLGFLPMLAWRFAFVGLAPVLLLHLFSYHPWHREWIGHYVYPVLPALLIASVLGMERLQAFARRLQGARHDGASPAPALLLLWLAFVSWTAAADDSGPPPAFRAAPERRSGLAELIERLPAQACVQAAIPVSPQLPLSHPVFPLLPPAGHRLRTAAAPFLDWAELATDCAERGLLFAPNDPRPPYYVKEHLEALDRIGEDAGEKSGWKLRRLP